MNLLVETEVLFSPDRVYRYWLARIWKEEAQRLLFFMLNPSTADEKKDDRTVAGCVARARLWGFGSVGIANLFALRSTDPVGLYAEGRDPVGPKNYEAILQALEWASTGMVICGWGNHGAYQHRDLEVLRLFAETDTQPWCLVQNENGQPAHPLYLGYEMKPVKLDVKRLLAGRIR
jgi:hypothetical protein